MPPRAARLALTISEVGQVVGVFLPVVEAAAAGRGDGEGGRRLGRVLVATLAARGLAGACKVAFGRSRPAAAGGRGDRLSFPSGHVTSTTCGAWMWAAAVAAREGGGPRARRAKLGALAVCLATAHGRVVGGRHHVGDVVAGLALGAWVGRLGAAQARAPSCRTASMRW